MEESAPIGTRRVIDGRARVFYYGYWVKAYDPRADTLVAKKSLLEALTRRLFNHVEHGINVPGRRLGEARAAFDVESDPQRRRVKGAMLAGALFNRASDLITKLVEIQALGVPVNPNDALMRECGNHLQEALALCRLVLHRSGEEGLDELWGEPFKAFAYPIDQFYESRYVKIAQTMGAIDRLRDELVRTVGVVQVFAGVDSLVVDFADVAKVTCETLRTDAEIFDVWASFVVAAEKLGAFRPSPAAGAPMTDEQRIAYGLQLIRDGKDIISHMTRARVPMPKTAGEFAARCERYRDAAPSPQRASGARSASPAPGL